MAPVLVARCCQVVTRSCKVVTRCCQLVTRCCQVVTRKCFGDKKWQEKCFGVAGVARKVFWHGGSGKKSVLESREWQEKCFCMVGVTILPPLAAIKSKQIFWTCYGGARSNLSPTSVRILSAAITNDRWTGALSDALAPRKG